MYKSKVYTPNLPTAQPPDPYKSNCSEDVDLQSPWPQCLVSCVRDLHMHLPEERQLLIVAQGFMYLYASG